MFDIFGSKPELQYRGHEKQISGCGIMLTYCFIGFSLWAIYFFGAEIVERQNPNTNQIDQYNEDPEPFTYSPDTFYAAFGLQNPDTFDHYIDPSIYSVSATYNIITKKLEADGSLKNVFNNIPIELVSCKKEYFGNLQNNTGNLDLKNLFCINPNQTNIESLEIRGKFESNIYKYINVDFKACKNGSSVVCAPQEKINSLLDGSYFAAYYADATIDLKNYDNPRNRFIDSSFTTFGQGYYKEYLAYIRNLEVIDDTGLLFQEQQSHTYQRFDKIQEISDLRNFDTFFKFVIRVGAIKTSYFRVYMKVQDLLANLDGTLTFILIIIALIAFPFIKMKFYEGLINEVFDLRLYRSDDEKNDKNGLYKKNLKGLRKKETMRFIPSKSGIPYSLSIGEMTDKDEEYDDIMTPKIRTDQENPNSQSFDPPPVKNLFHRQTKSTYDFRPRSDEFDKIGKPDENLKSSVKPEFEMSQLGSFANDENHQPIETVHTKQKYDQTNVFQHKLNQTIQLQEKNLKESNLKSLYKDSDIDEINFAAVAGVNYESNSTENLDTNKKELITKSSSKSNSSEKNKHVRIQAADEENDSEPKKIIHNHIKRTESIFHDVETHKGLNLSIVEYFRSWFSLDVGLKKKLELLEEGKGMINQRLDIFNIMQKLREIDKLKALFLDKDQLTLFNCLPKPVLDRESRKVLKDKVSKSHATLTDDHFVAQYTRENIRNAFENLTSKDAKSLIDLRLIAIFEGEV